MQLRAEPNIGGGGRRINQPVSGAVPYRRRDAAGQLVIAQAQAGQRCPDCQGQPRRRARLLISPRPITNK